ncbi:hypothetical protein [Rhizorhabdus argentea]|uniref:hypothetical protein n=1 Tax=Rhizorhabdus argentea TaxID=1387174 RepID=UPI0030EEDA5F
MRAKILGMAMALLLSAPALGEVPIDPGETAMIRLSPQRELSYAIAPPLPHAPANHGAILSVDIDEGGRYHVALGAPGWVDMVRDGKALEPVGDRPGPAGSAVAKILDYDLLPGRYVLALSGMADGEVTVMISR